MTQAFILAVIFVVVNGLTQLKFAQGMGFKLKPAGLAFLIGATLSLMMGNVTPLSGQSAMITLAGRNKEERERVFSLLIASSSMALFGIFGVVSNLVVFAGPAIMSGMMAGVGVMVFQVGYEFTFDKTKGNFWVGIISIVSALAAFSFFTQQGSPHTLVYVVAISVSLATIPYLIKKDYLNEAIVEEQTSPRFWTKAYWSEFKLVKPLINGRSVLNGLALLCLGLGVTTSFGLVNANISGVPLNADGLAMLTGFSDVASVLFGGLPLEAIISGTSAAPVPVWGAFAVMMVLGLMCLLGLVTRICKYIPTQSIAGFLMVIGLFSTFIPNITTGMNAEHAPLSAITLIITVVTKNPFIGIMVGIGMRTFGWAFGINL